MGNAEEHEIAERVEACLKPIIDGVRYVLSTGSNRPSGGVLHIKGDSERSTENYVFGPIHCHGLAEERYRWLIIDTAIKEMTGNLNLKPLVIIACPSSINAILTGENHLVSVGVDEHGLSTSVLGPKPTLEEFGERPGDLVMSPSDRSCQVYCGNDAKCTVFSPEKMANADALAMAAGVVVMLQFPRAIAVRLTDGRVLLAVSREARMQSLRGVMTNAPKELIDYVDELLTSLNA